MNYCDAVVFEDAGSFPKEQDFVVNILNAHLTHDDVKTAIIEGQSIIHIAIYDCRERGRLSFRDVAHIAQRCGHEHRFCITVALLLVCSSQLYAIAESPTELHQGNTKPAAYL